MTPTIVLTLFLITTSGAQELVIPGVWDGDDMKPFASLEECSRMGQPIAAQYLVHHPGVVLDAFTCGPERASN